MAEIIAGVKSNFILSINDLPEIREIFSGLRIRPVELRYSVSRGKSTKGKELLISGFR